VVVDRRPGPARTAHVTRGHMHRLMGRVRLSMVVAAVAACSFPRPALLPEDGGVDGGGADGGTTSDARTCTDTECSAPTPVCDQAGSMTCVQCTVDHLDQCNGTTPACSADHMCRGCISHEECPNSKVCLEDGSCAKTEDTAYVQSDGAGTSCTKSSPCATLEKGLDTKRPYVKIAIGLVKDNKTTLISGQKVTILADHEAHLDSDGDGPILRIDEAADVRIFDLEIGGATGVVDGAGGIQVNGVSANPIDPARLSLNRVKVTNVRGGAGVASSGDLIVSDSVISENTGTGILADGGSLSIARSTISNNGGRGIECACNFLTIIGSVISGNHSQGVAVSGGVTSMRANFIHHNGNLADANPGGVSLSGVPKESIIEFNTIADNQAKVAMNTAGGVACETSQVNIGNSIIFRNVGGVDGNSQVMGGCTFAASISIPGANGQNPLGFKSPDTAPFDYHLTASSPPSVIDAVPVCTGTDFDGDVRPVGVGCDLGADELASAQFNLQSNSLP